MRVAIQTGTFATIFVVGDLITFCEALPSHCGLHLIFFLVLFPEMNYYGMFTFPIGRIYTNVRPCHVIPDTETDDRDGDC